MLLVEVFLWTNTSRFFYRVLEHSVNVLLCSSGGQFPNPILYDGDKACSLFERGRPVGLFEDSDYAEHLVELPGTFILVLVSDGILELLPRGSAQERAGFIRGQGGWKN